jgi:hypothetical protein
MKENLIMNIATRARFMAKYNPNTMTGNTVRMLLVIMALMEVKEDAKANKLSEDTEALLLQIDKNPLLVMEFMPISDELIDRFKELNNGTSIKEA